MSTQRRPFLIHRPTGPYGFFSDFLFVLDALDEADRQGLCPVVDMQRYPTQYSESDAVNHSRNAWEYYFHQPEGITVDEALTLDPVEHAGTRTDVFSTYDFRHWREKWRRGRLLIERYVHVREDITLSVDAAWSDRSGVIGVHYRGSDMKAGVAYGHPVPQSLDSFVETTAAILDNSPAQSILLATDDEQAVNRFRQQFGERVWMTSASRVSDEYDGQTMQPWLTDSTRSQHRYLSGREVLTDALLLARCSHLVHGWSNVAKAAALFSESFPVRTELAPTGFAGKRRPIASAWRRLQRAWQMRQLKRGRRAA